MVLSIVATHPSAPLPAHPLQLINFVEELNRKCPHTWKLDAIWGSRPNNKPDAVVETLQSPSESTIPVDPGLLIDEIATGGATGSELEDDNDSDGGGASRSVTRPSKR